jgi:serine/threonine-protein kinase
VTITGTFVLPPDVALVPVDAIPAERRNFRHDEGDWAITRRRSRTPSRILGSDAAALVKEFAEPRSIVEAILRFSRARGVDAEETLESSYPLLDALVGSGVLVAEDAAQEIRATLHAGDPYGDWTVVALVQLLEDTELYQVRRGKELGALKIASTKLDRERRALERIGVPRVLDRGDDFLIVDWLRGVDANVAAAERRHDRNEIASLCRTIVEVYAALHAKGVIHGDVHQRNLLVDRDDSVRIIDFGNARIDGDRAARAGVAFFHEPELAAAMRSGRTSPLASERGEQYAVAAMLYSLVTGAHYRDFSLERSELLREIEEEPPLPFRERGLEPWPAMEEALAVALQKDPAARHASMSEFAAALPRPFDTPSSGPSLRSGPPSPPRGEKGLAMVVGRMRASPSQQRSASVNFGAAGIAYAQYRMACARGDAELLAQADVTLMNATVEAGEYSVIAPLHAPTGHAYVQALIAAARGDERTLAIATARFIAAASQDEPCLDLATGMSGALLAAASLLTLREDPALRALGDALHERIWSSDLSSLNLGVAHGWAGVLLASLRWSQASGTALHPGFDRRVDDIRDAAIHTGRGTRWRWAGDVSMPGWCNGSAGILLLFAALGDREWTENAAWNAWETPSANATLCCGLAGQAYALLAAYRTTGDGRWVSRAKALAAREDGSGLEEGLFKGREGVEMLGVELERADGAVFPMME